MNEKMKDNKIAVRFSLAKFKLSEISFNISNKWSGGYKFINDLEQEKNVNNVFSLDYDNRNGIFGTLDYTLQSAVGTASDPFQAQNAISNNQLPEIQIVPLDWD